MFNASNTGNLFFNYGQVPGGIGGMLSPTNALLSPGNNSVLNQTGGINLHPGQMPMERGVINS